MKAVYEKEMLRLVKRLTGAERVYTNGHISRSEVPEAAGIERPTSHHIVHNDFTPSFRATLENRMDAIKPFLDGGGRVCIYNTWRRFDPDGWRSPLALWCAAHRTPTCRRPAPLVVSCLLLPKQPSDGHLRSSLFKLN